MTTHGPYSISGARARVRPLLENREQDSKLRSVLERLAGPKQEVKYRSSWPIRTIKDLCCSVGQIPGWPRNRRETGPPGAKVHSRVRRIGNPTFPAPRRIPEPTTKPF